VKLDSDRIRFFMNNPRGGEQPTQCTPEPGKLNLEVLYTEIKKKEETHVRVSIENNLLCFDDLLLEITRRSWKHPRRPKTAKLTQNTHHV